MIPPQFAPDRIRLVNIQPLGRASSFFVQGLFDGHPQVVTIPMTGYLSAQEIAQPSLHRLARALFTARCARLYQQDKIPASAIAWAKFHVPFKDYVRAYGRTRKNIFIAMHYAVACAMGTAQTVRYIVFQGHSLELSLPSFEDFPDQQVLFLTRDPRATYCSRKPTNPYNTPLFMLQVVYYAERFARAYPQQQRILYVRHEDVHRRFATTMRRMRKFLDLPDHPSLRYSSFYGLPYTGKGLEGQSITQVFTALPNPAYAHDRWMRELSPSELRVLNWCFRTYIARHRYARCRTPNRQARFFNMRFADYLRTYFIGTPQETAVHRAVYALARVPVVGDLLLRTLTLCIYAGAWSASAIMFRVRIHKLTRLLVHRPA